MIELMSKDSLCIQQKDCAGCPKATEGILIHRHMLRGQHIPKDKCTQNCMLFIIKGELLVNSDEYPGTTLHDKQFILQAIGSKHEALALTDTEYIVFWFNELPLLCEDRYREIIDQAEAPLAYTPLVMDHRLLNLVTDMAAYLDEPVPPCNKFINLKCQELVYLITNYYPLPQLKSFFHPISSYTESFHYFVMQNYTKVKNVEEFAHLGGYTTTTFRRLFRNFYGIPVYEWILEKNGKASWKTSSTLNYELRRSATGTVSTPSPTLHTSAKILSETLRAPYARKQPMAKNRKDHRLRNYFFNSLVNQSISPIFAVCKRCKTSKF